jgi:hypothetical protein
MRLARGKKGLKTASQGRGERGSRPWPWVGGRGRKETRRDKEAARRAKDSSGCGALTEHSNIQDKGPLRILGPPSVPDS